MRVIIYGAGAIGCVVGGHLGRTGHDVVLIGRPGQVNAIQKNGLRFVTTTGTHILHLPAVTSPTQIDFGSEDVVLLCVKGQNTEEAIRDLHDVTKDVPVFCFQNGVRNEGTVARYFPRVYGAMLRIPAYYIIDGEVKSEREPPGWIIIGRYPEGDDELVEAVAANLRTAGFLVKVTPDVMPYKWGKLIRNLHTTVIAITNESEEAVLPLVKIVRQEAQEIVSQAGIRLVDQEQVAKEWPEATVPPKSKPLDKARSSTWQSLARKQGTVEVEFFQGEIVRLAKQLGREAPMNEKLLRICEEMAANRELPGRYTLAQLSTLLGLDGS